MTSQGSPATRFKRAVERRSLINAELAAREMNHVSLEGALALVVLYAEQGEPRFERAAVRWLGRLFLESDISVPAILETGRDRLTLLLRSGCSRVNLDGV